MQLKHRFVEEIPDALDRGVFYASIVHRTTIHLCCCGCGNEVVLPLDPAEWKLTFDGEAISMHPSVGNWNFPCRSHYWIRGGHIRWAEQWSDAQIAAGVAHEHGRRTAQISDKMKTSPARVPEPMANNAPPSHQGLMGYMRSILRRFFK